MTVTPSPPIATKKPIEIAHHGVKTIDDYAWLRDPNWQELMRDPSRLKPEIRQYLEAENAFAEKFMANTKDVQKALFNEMRGRIKEDDTSVPDSDGPYAYSTRFYEGAQHPQIIRSLRDGSNTVVLLDANVHAMGKAYFELGDAMHSPGHNLLAWSYDELGSEFYTLRIRDLNTGEDFSEVIPNTAGHAVFSKNEEYLYYTWLDETHRPCKVKRHKVGESYKDDVIIYEEPDAGYFVTVCDTQSAEYIVIETRTHQTSEVRFFRSDQPTSEPRLVAKRIEGQQYSVNHLDDRFIILTNADDAEDFKVVTAPIENPGREQWTDIVPHKLGRYIIEVIPYKNHFIRLEREDGLPRIVIHQLQDGTEHQISFDEDAYSLGLIVGYEFDTNTIRYTYSSMTTPSQVFDYDMETRVRTLRKEQEIPSGHQDEDYITGRIFATAEDGEQVPITLLYHKNTKLDGSAPCFQYGYGSYGIATSAAFQANALSLVDRGFVYAIAHVRGGKDKGYHWYKNGRREFKKNTFTDFIAVSRHLIAEGLVDKSKIVAYGGSAGGMLVGAVANMSPELYHGIIADVPFVDVLNTMLDETLPLTPPEWPEWGNPIKDVKDYEYIASYSPYDNIGKFNYPAILTNSGLTDPRVTYWEPTKWVAKLRSNNQGDNPIILNMKMDSGHSGASGRFDFLEEIAYNFAFVLKICGKIS